MSSAKTQERIAKLRALADRPGTPAEGATARRLADELEASIPPEPKHRIRETRGADSAERKRRSIIVNIDPAWLYWGFEIAWQMAKEHRKAERKAKRAR